MKVAFNGTALLGPLTGVGQYTYQLAVALQRLPDVQLELFYGMSSRNTPSYRPAAAIEETW